MKLLSQYWKTRSPIIRSYSKDFIHILYLQYKTAQLKSFTEKRSCIESPACKLVYWPPNSCFWHVATLPFLVHWKIGVLRRTTPIARQSDSSEFILFRFYWGLWQDVQLLKISFKPSSRTLTILRSNLLHNVLGPQQGRNHPDSLPAEDKHLTPGASQQLLEQRLQQMLPFSSKSMSMTTILTIILDKLWQYNLIEIHSDNR